MLNAELVYNPYMKEAALKVDGKDHNLDCFGNKGARELSEWVSDFFTEISSDFAQKDISVSFTGLERDFDFLDDAALFFNKNQEGNAEVIHKKIIRANDKLEGLKKMFARLQSEAPFEELKDKNIEKKFKKAVSDEFEMAVIATMSSGKSTLINAMLGREILPARNEATTAVIAKIHNNDNADHFLGTSYDSDGNCLANCDPLTLESMNELNNNPLTSNIEIEGNIKGIRNSESMKLVLIDTPGPNNSRPGQNHRTITYELLNQEYKPMILYVLNATQLEVDSDANLLKDVAEQMEKMGRQSRDRFIFVLNKADEFDNQKEKVAKKIEDAKNYLARFGINEPRIFPCASLLAKIIRQYQTDENPISKKERIELLNTSELFLEEEDYHFSDFSLNDNSLLGREAREELKRMLKDAKQRGDRYEETLIYTGIPSVELAISEYLAKYALPAKITKGVDSFIQTIRGTSAEANTMQDIESNKDEIKKLRQSIDKLKCDIEKGKKAKILKSKISALYMKSDVDRCLQTIVSYLSNRLENNISQMRSHKLTKSEARIYTKEIKAIIRDISAKFTADIQDAFQKNIEEQGQKFIDEYKKYVSGLLGEINITKPSAVIGYLSEISIDDVLEDYSYNEEAAVGEHEEIVGYRRVPNPKRKGFFGFFKFWHPREIDEAVYQMVTDYENHEYIDFNNYIDNEIKPNVEEFFLNNRKEILEKAEIYEKNLKDAFIKKFEELEVKINEKLSEKNDYLLELLKGEAKLKENKEKLNWLHRYMTDLENLLVSIEG